jgi:hypothetical protein
MTTNDIADPAAQDAAQDADRRAERAKASLLSRVELLKHKFTDAKQKLDVPAQIAKHPLPAVGIAFALGVAAALRRPSLPMPVMPGESGRSLRGAAFTALAAFGLHIVREVALGQLGQVARQWWAEASGDPAAEAQADRPADVEPFLEY